MKKPLDDNAVAASGYTYLALGDSYTIGEQVAAKENFPHQLSTLIKSAEPTIIAQTGWTTDELNEAIKKAGLQQQFDLVTLLIGVNNQYRGRTVAEYIPEFESLLKQAIQFAGNNPRHVIVLSIPDWGATPFAEGRDRKQIATEIDAYNSANESIAKKYGVPYINITQSTREATDDPSLLAADGLHLSGKEYAKWAKKLAALIQENL